ncbi:unnamed protein product [Candida verbasci]|uniref:Anaphase-promoting complex subunit 5 n=1 Tax=Candida verbasci TaxID=1227364 RepID=A0A9W4TZL9_9ASCO|nr:unnamed protein product [Candida verbasci]
MINNDIKLLLTEDLSAYKISLLILIHFYILNKLKSRTLVALVKLIENKSILQNENGNLIINPTLLDLCKFINYDDQIEKQLLQFIWSFNSIEDLDKFTRELVKYVIVPTDSTIKPSKIKLLSSRSLFGSFILKICTCFACLKFDESNLLFKSFKQFRESSRELYINYGGIIIEKEEDPDLQLFKKLNSKIDDLNLSYDTELMSLPKTDISVLLDKQIEIMESFGTPTPEIIKNAMMLMLNSEVNPNINKIQNISFNNLPSYYYLKYLESLSQSNYNESFNYLHQYFDYMVSSNSKYFYHFALISKASLHQYFNEDNKALDTIEEAISIARENKDNSTLTYILSWLFDFIKNKPNLWKLQNFYNSNDSNLLDFLIIKSKDISSVLYSMAYYFKTLQMISNNELMENFITNSINSLFISIGDSKPTFVKSCELTSSVYNKTGESYLSEIYNELSMDFTDRLIDKISLKVRFLYSRFLQGGNDEEIYQEFQVIKEQYMDHSLYNSVQTRSSIILIRINLKKGKFRVAKELIDILLDNDNKIIELRNELILLQIEIEICLENYSYAMKLISQIESTNNYLHIKLDLLKCKILNKCGKHYRCLSLLLQNIQLCDKVGFLPLYIEGMLIYLNILNELDYKEEVQKICQTLIPKILSVDNLEFISIAYFEYSKSIESQEKLQYLSISINNCIKNNDLIFLRKCYKYKTN